MEGNQDSPKSGIQIKEAGFLLMIAIRNLQREIQHPGLSSITLHGAIFNGNGSEWKLASSFDFF